MTRRDLHIFAPLRPQYFRRSSSTLFASLNFYNVNFLANFVCHLRSAGRERVLDIPAHPQPRPQLPGRLPAGRAGLRLEAAGALAVAAYRVRCSAMAFPLRRCISSIFCKEGCQCLPNRVGAGRQLSRWQCATMQVLQRARASVGRVPPGMHRFHFFLQ